MKAAVIKIGARIAVNSNSTSGATGEAESICKMLHRGGAEVHIFTKILKKDNLIPEYTWYNIVDSILPEYIDALVVINGKLNFFGGAEDVEQLLNYKIINNFEGPVFYIYCDPELTLSQVWSSVSKKPWANRWKKEDIEITRADIRYISQPYKIDLVAKNFSKNDIKPATIVHYPLEKFPCLNEIIPYNENPDVYLSYGGTMRGERRFAKMVKFYLGHPSNISVEMFGKINESDFLGRTLDRLPNFTGPVRYDQMLPKMNKAMTHCVIGDPYYEEVEDNSQRIYESIFSSVVTFIDADMDKSRRVFGSDKTLSDFLYVSTRQDLTEKLQLLKSDPSLRKQIVEDQFKAVSFDPEEYCKEFVKCLQ